MTPLRNWTAAVHGSLFQFCIFLALNLEAGSDTVVGAIVTDLVLRGLASRWWRSTRHSLEPVVQWLRSAPRLASGIAAFADTRGSVGLSRGREGVVYGAK